MNENISDSELNGNDIENYDWSDSQNELLLNSSQFDDFIDLIDKNEVLDYHKIFNRNIA